MVCENEGEEDTDADKEDDIADHNNGSSDGISSGIVDNDIEENNDRGDIGVSQNMDENDDDDDDEGDFDSGNDNVMDWTESSSIICKCKMLSRNFLKRISQRNARSAGLDSHGGLMKAPEVLINLNISLDHVCYKHLKDYGAHFGLQVKSLTADMLRYRLGQLWKHRGDLDAFQVRAESKLWWRRTSRPHIEEDDHGVFAHRAKKDTLIKARNRP